MLQHTATHFNAHTYLLVVHHVVHVLLLEVHLLLQLELLLLLQLLRGEVGRRAVELLKSCCSVVAVCCSVLRCIERSSEEPLSCCSVVAVRCSVVAVCCVW